MKIKPQVMGCAPPMTASRRKNDPENASNQRAYFRFSMLGQAQFCVGYLNSKYVTSWGDCIVLDMSGGGCRIATPLALPVSEIPIHLNFRIGDDEFSFEAKIVWKDIDDEKSIFKYGLQWVNLTKKIRENLLKILVLRDTKRRKRLWEK